MKKIIKNGGYTLYISILFWAILICPAYAYLDPGTGSYIVQIIIGTVLAASVTIKLYWKKIIHLFTKKG